MATRVSCPHVVLDHVGIHHAPILPLWGSHQSMVLWIFEPILDQYHLAVGVELGATAGHCRWLWPIFAE
jgi:hypothetical protein